MKSVVILYDIQHFEMFHLVEDTIEKLSQRTGTKINIKICNGYELLHELKINPNYNFIILHMGRNDEGHISKLKDVEVYLMQFSC